MLYRRESPYRVSPRFTVWYRELELLRDELLVVRGFELVLVTPAGSELERDAVVVVGRGIAATVTEFDDGDGTILGAPEEIDL